MLWMATEIEEKLASTHCLLPQPLAFLTPNPSIALCVPPQLALYNTIRSIVWSFEGSVFFGLLAPSILHYHNVYTCYNSEAPISLTVLIPSYLLATTARTLIISQDPFLSYQLNTKFHTSVYLDCLGILTALPSEITFLW